MTSLKLYNVVSASQLTEFLDNALFFFIVYLLFLVFWCKAQKADTTQKCLVRFRKVKRFGCGRELFSL